MKKTLTVCGIGCTVEVTSSKAGWWFTNRNKNYGAVTKNINQWDIEVLEPIFVGNIKATIQEINA